MGKYFDGSEQVFVKYVILPQVVERELRIKYNSDTAANQREYGERSSAAPYKTKRAAKPFRRAISAYVERYKKV